MYLRRLFNRLRVLVHPCILRYRAMYINMKKRTCHLVMDYITHPTLNDFIHHPNKHRKPLL